MPLPSTHLERLVQCCLFNRCFRILFVSASFLFMSRDASPPLIDREVDEGVGCVDAAVVLDPQLVKALRAHRQSTRPFVDTQLVKALRTHTQQRGGQRSGLTRKFPFADGNRLRHTCRESAAQDHEKIRTREAIENLQLLS